MADGATYVLLLPDPLFLPAETRTNKGPASSGAPPPIPAHRPGQTGACLPLRGPRFVLSRTQSPPDSYKVDLGPGCKGQFTAIILYNIHTTVILQSDYISALCRSPLKQVMSDQPHVFISTWDEIHKIFFGHFRYNLGALCVYDKASSGSSVKFIRSFLLRQVLDRYDAHGLKLSLTDLQPALNTVFKMSSCLIKLGPTHVC